MGKNKNNLRYYGKLWSNLKVEELLKRSIANGSWCAIIMGRRKENKNGKLIEKDWRLLGSTVPSFPLNMNMKLVFLKRCKVDYTIWVNKIIEIIQWVTKWSQFTYPKQKKNWDLSSLKILVVTSWLCTRANRIFYERFSCDYTRIILNLASDSTQNLLK